MDKAYWSEVVKKSKKEALHRSLQKGTMQGVK